MCSRRIRVHRRSVRTAASEKVETAARGHSVYCVNTALSAHAVENTSPCFLQVK